jgi:16S rRNA (cytosine967-C5)-methyltransferase
MEERERALATEIVYGVLRRRLILDRLIGAASTRPLGDIDPVALGALRVGLYQILFLDRIPHPAAVDESVRMVRERLGRGGAAFANGVLRQCCRLIDRGDRAATPPRPAASSESAGEATAERLAEKHSYPRFLVERYLARFGCADCESLLDTMNRPPATALRPTRRAGGAEALAKRLEQEGVIAVPSPILPGALRVVRGVPQRSAAFRDGMFYIQDEASQMVARLVLPAEGPVLDLCAAPGGKALQIADEATEPVKVVAADRSSQRLALLRQNAARLGADSLRVVAMDAGRPGLRGRFARILIDAPCTGTGVIRRHPEIRWRRQPSDFARFGRTQFEILQAAAGLLAPGGRLVYAVCSLEPEEGVEPITRLLAAHPGLHLVDVRTLLEDSLHGLSDVHGFLTTLPHRHDVDGFFAAVVRSDDAT